MTVHNLALQTITLAGFHPGVDDVQPQIPIPTQAGMATRWQCLAVNNDGSVRAVIPIVGNPVLVWGLDLALQGTFSVSLDTDVSQMALGVSEVQLYRNGVLMLFGPVVSRRANTADRTWSYTAYDPLWYFTHRYFGESARHNYLPNGNFESSLAGWTNNGTIVSSQSTTQAILGTHSAKLVSTLDNGDDYIVATFPMTAGVEGLALFLTAWVYVESYSFGAFGDRGCYIGRVGATDTQAWAQDPLTKDSAPVGKWSRLSTFIEMPPNETRTIEVRLYAPHGTIYWDAVTVTIAESVSFVNINSAGGAGWDQIDIAQLIVKYASGAYPIGSFYTKSNLNIAVAGAASGVKKQRTYLFSDHQLIMDALTAFTQSSDGFDFRMECTPTKRVFRTYYPSVGRTWTGLAFRYEHDPTTDDETARDRSWGIVAVDWPETIEGSATDVTEMGGWGTGAGREEAAATNHAAFGGLTIELVESAPSEAPIDLLLAIATSRLGQLDQTILTPTLTMVEPRDPTTQEVLLSLIGALLPGDIIPIVISDGGMALGASNAPVNVRVSQVTLNADETLTVAITP